MLYDSTEYTNSGIQNKKMSFFYKDIYKNISDCPSMEGYVLFNNALNTFYLQLYGIRHVVKYPSDSERKPAATTWATLSD